MHTGPRVRGKGDLSAYWVGISSAGNFLGTPPSYTLIRDPMLRLCHRLIACSIARRSQTPEKVLEGLIVIVRDLPVIDMAELVRLQICMDIDDTWAWVDLGPERHQVAAAGAPEAPQPPPPAAGPSKTMAQRLAKVEEDVHEIRGALGEQRDVLDSMARDFSRFSTWTVVGLSQMMSQARVRYTSYADFQIMYVRRTRRMTDNASTSTAHVKSNI
ncbi:hypothetical protein Tco_1295226 [Tanacetum coccineum]